MYAGKITGLNLTQYSCQMFRQNVRQHFPDKTLEKRGIAEFESDSHPNPFRKWEINRLRGDYNRGHFGKPKIISMCYGKDGIVRTVEEELNRKRSEAYKGKPCSEETRKKISKANKKWCKKHPKELQKLVQAGQAAQRRPQSGKQELGIFHMVDGWFPKAGLKSTGDTRIGKNYIGSRCPDITGQKIKVVVDFDGGGHEAYRIRKGKYTEKQDVQRRRKHYRKFGYRLFVIFDIQTHTDLKDLPKLRRRLKRFINYERQVVD